MEYGKIAAQDGIALLLRGDLFVAVYAGDSTTERSRWLIARAIESAEQTPSGLIVLLLIPASSRPPDEANRKLIAESYVHLDPRMRLHITVPEGNLFHVSLVRMVMGAALMLQKKREVHRVCGSLHDAIDAIRAAATAATPSPSEIGTDVSALRDALARKA